MYQLGKFTEAESHFEKALGSDLNHIDTYYYYVNLLIQTGEYAKAKKLIKYAYKIKGVNLSRMKHNEGLIAEINGDYQKAKKYVSLAYDSSYKKAEREFLKDELDRVNSKIKGTKKSGSKKSGTE
jgi:tetratricopeptide (TPR) repeat protein